MALHIETPLLHSRPLSLQAGRPVWLKMEALQPAGSFKLRGVGALCEALAARGVARFVSSSGGNAGLAAAYAGRLLGIPVTVVVPQSSTARARDMIAQEGAELVVHGASWAEAHAHAGSLTDARTALIHPFDDPTLWAGHATLIDEVVQSGVPFDSVVLSVGGGGLLAGVVAGLERHGLGHVPVVAVETAGADSLAQSVAAGQRIELSEITSLATSLGARQVCTQAFALTRTHPIQPVVVSDAAALRACVAFLDQHRVLVEPACGAALAVVMDPAQGLPDTCRAPLVVVCGGVTATLDSIRMGLHGSA